MKLTETQRDFLTKTLGVKPSGKGLLQRRTSEEKKSDTATEAFNDYLGREKKVLDAVHELEGVPGTQKLVAEFEKQVGEIQARVKGATKDNAEAVIKKAYKDLEDIKARAQSEAATHTKNIEYYRELEAARKSLEELRKHAQQAQAKQKIDGAQADLTNAERKASAGKFKEARPLVEAAKQKATEGKQIADDHAAYEAERAAVQLLIDGLKAHAQ